MSSVRDNDFDEQYSVLEDEAGVKFLDFEDKSFRNFNPLLDEGPVVISMPFPFYHGKPRSALVGETAADLLTIRNTTDEPVELWSVRIYSSNPKDSYLLSLMRPPGEDSDENEIQSFLGSTELEDRVLQPDETLDIWLSCKPQEVGMHTAVIHIVVGDEKLERVAFLLADDSISQALASSKPFTRAQRKKKFDLNGYVPASHPSRPNKRQFCHRLPRFVIPSEIRELIESQQIPNVIQEGLNGQNYAAFFSSLLIMEEIHLEGQMRAYDMECVSLKRKGRSLVSLVVHGLAERRPSLVCSDSLFVKPTFRDPGNDPRPYQGYIVRVDAEEIFIEFAAGFHEQHHDGNRYDITFAFNRLSMRKQHLAVQFAEETGSEILIPSKNRRIMRPGKQIIPFNQNLNQEQLRSVEKILEIRGAPPYIIYGPPGTGKTKTLVEAILQIFRKDAKARILVCAPSNSAADHIMDNLLAAAGDGGTTVKTSKIFRLNAPSRQYDDVKSDHIQFCFMEGTTFQCPPLGALLGYRIVISTYISSYLLYSHGLRQGHFDYMFLDEAGQASEPETMVPLMGVCPNKTTVILAGDPMQLGPVICSNDAARYGLQRSYLQRLFDFDFYASEDADYLTKLVKNYRSHPAILRLPSDLFYEGELVPYKRENEKRSMLDPLGLPNKDFPVLFVGVQGCDEREGSSPSWFNRTEISKVVETVRRLMLADDLEASDIGIITPYLQQVIKLRKAFESIDMSGVTVGSVEKFQGQEREVIILSTVRSTVKHNEFDRVYSLGFLTNPRRFNVAITRAKSLLVIIGNPHVISKDPFWDKLLRYCANNESYRGCPLPDPEITVDAPAKDAQSKVSEWISDWDESLQSQSRQYSNDVEWDEQLPGQEAKELPCQPSQYLTEVEWDKQLPGEEAKEPPRLLSQYSTEVEWDEQLPGQDAKELPYQPSQYITEAEWDKRLPGQNAKEPPCLLSQYSTEVEWDEKRLGHNAKELPCRPSQYSDEVGWDEHLLGQEGTRRGQTIMREKEEQERRTKGHHTPGGQWRPVTGRWPVGESRSEELQLQGKMVNGGIQKKKAPLVGPSDRGEKNKWRQSKLRWC